MFMYINNACGLNPELSKEFVKAYNDALIQVNMPAVLYCNLMMPAVLHC